MHSVTVFSAFTHTHTGQLFVQLIAIDNIVLNGAEKWENMRVKLLLISWFEIHGTLHGCIKNEVFTIIQ